VAAEKEQGRCSDERAECHHESFDAHIISSIQS
jgi:hypothetical protein